MWSLYSHAYQPVFGMYHLLNKSFKVPLAIKKITKFNKAITYYFIINVNQIFRIF